MPESCRSHKAPQPARRLPRLRSQRRQKKRDLKSAGIAIESPSALRNRCAICQAQPRPKQGLRCVAIELCSKLPVDRHRQFDCFYLCAALTPPWEQIGGEVGGGPLFARRTRWSEPLEGVRRDHLTIEMPGRVTEQRDHDRKTEKERDRPCH